MVDYHELSTQKLVDEVQKKEFHQLRKQMAKESRKSLMLFAFAFLVFLLAMFTVFQMPNWMPAVQSWLDQAGILTSTSVEVIK